MDCPDCSVPLRDPEQCPCGWKKPGTSRGGKGYKNHACAFVNNGVRCRMPGEGSDGGPMYCGWHFLCLTHPEYLRNYVKFEAFVESRQLVSDETFKKWNLPLRPNAWRRSPLQLWKLVGGEHSSRYEGDRKQASTGAEKSPQDYLDEASRNIGRSAKPSGPVSEAEIEARRQEAERIVAEEQAKQEEINHERENTGAGSQEVAGQQPDQGADHQTTVD